MTWYSPVCSMRRCSSAMTSRNRPPTRRSTSAAAVPAGVIHCAIAAGSVHAAKMSAAEARTTRLTYARGGLPGIGLAVGEVPLQRVDAALPEALIQPGPGVGRREWFRSERQPVVATADASAHE